ncbi:kinesin-like protein KIF27 [Gigantopelta aegis]|uniref:kinesin-like protein KIF27 n=1 Tax=Gigantopelta aegis TaxID=1735272 RepID=UPI001B88B5ED|nr:kinesin-like protein KIF27 [Gigantopelta aegis]
MAEVNVRVAVRVRPLLPKERLGGEQMCVRVIPNTNQLIVGKDRGFTFDNVLSAKSSQVEVYQTCVEPLVKSIFEGYNATVFAYGQTGSGKTYTIGGCNLSAIPDEEVGVIPRALTQMFIMMKANDQIEYLVKVSYIEIYKEELRDLLDLETSNKDLHVREDDQGNTVIVGAREIECETLDEVVSLLQSGSMARHTGSTQMNEHSSRSHSVFTVVIDQKWSESDDRKSQIDSDSAGDFLEEVPITHTMSGKFHFVDLAGSERAHRTGNVGDRFKESIHINTGLLSLGNVISALGDPKKKATHIPYRDSKITRLLKDSLGGNAKTLMVCCISPASVNFDETLNALKYANRAKNIKNKPIVNRDIQSIRFEEMQSEIKALREELARQRTSVLSVIGGDINIEKAQQDADSIRELEDQVIKLQTECSHYRMVSEEAYRQLLDIQDRNILSKSLDIRLKDWLDLMEELKNKVPRSLTRESLDNQTITTLTSELKKCKEDLKSDEEIFAEKSRETSHLLERIQELELEVDASYKFLKTAEEQHRLQEQRMLEQQLQIQELQRTLRNNLVGDSSIMDNATVTSSAPPTTGRRPKSVPVHLHRNHEKHGSLLRPPSRHIKSSPALFSLERVMQSFRARSQLLVSRLEDSDEVLHQTFSDENLPESVTNLTDISPLVRRGTYRVKKQVRGDDNKENRLSIDSLPDVRRSIPVTSIRSSTRILESIDCMERQSQESRLINIETRNSTELQKKKIKQAQFKVLESNQKMRDLAINIRMKEQLIRELVKSGKDATTMNKQYAEKVRALEREADQVKMDLVETQKALQDLEAKEIQETAEKQKLQQDYHKKIEAAKMKMTALQKKQKETEKVVNFAIQNEKKIQDLELAVDRMKQHYENLQKKFKDETEQKAKLEREMQKELQRVKELELKNEQQQKILRRKNEEIAAANRRLRSGSLPPINMQDYSKLEEQKKWVDEEIEKVLHMRKQNEELQEELVRREAIVAKKENMLAEKSELEIKKLRSSQMMSQDLVKISAKLDTVDKKIEEKKKELAETPEEQKKQLKEDIAHLKHTREKLRKQRSAMDEKIHEGQVLSPKEERRLIELDEAIEALDAAIEFKNDNIESKQMDLRQSQLLAQSEDNLMNRLNSLSLTETKTLLSKYFDKVINLREGERRVNLQCSEMEVKVDEQERVIRELDAALQRSVMETDRKLMFQQKEYEQKMQILMHQLAEGSPDNGGADSTHSLKMHQLEKELYYYKKTSRDMKKKLRELISAGVLSSQGFEDFNVGSSIQSTTDQASVKHNGTPRDRPGLLTGSRDKMGYIPTPREKSSYVGTPTDVMSSRESSQVGVRDLDTAGSRPTSSRIVLKSNNDLPQSITPVKISRKDLRPMSEEEINLRRSNLSKNNDSTTLQDSLDNGNPWS